jgi:hypothetical protein
MTKQEFEKILIENKKKNEQAMENIRKSNQAFSKKVREILAIL